MRTIEMRPITIRTKHGLVRIDGGWHIQVPEVEPIMGDLKLLTAALLDDCGYDASLAQRKAVREIALEYAQARVRNVRASVAHWARQYMKRYPWVVQRKQDHIVLRGFDPVRAASLYWPNDNTGRRGKDFGEQFLRTMALEVEHGGDH